MNLSPQLVCLQPNRWQIMVMVVMYFQNAIFSSAAINSDTNFSQNYSLPPVDSNITNTLGKQRLLHDANQSILGPCTRCRLLINSIYENLKNVTLVESKNTIKIDPTFLTSIDKFREIKKQVDFSKIWNKLCFDIKAGRDDCRSLAELNFEEISNWWLHDDLPDALEGGGQSNNVIYTWLCIHTLELCCPEGHFGRHCSPCIGYPEGICSRNGKCSGTGTRLGDGHCVCRKGYIGDTCAQCDKAYYLNQTQFNANATIQCLACDISCKDSCLAGGPRGCHVCKDGFAWDHEYGCFDIDECDPERPNPCPKNSFCINTEGSFQCYQCDHACDGCNGDGPDSCLKCAKNHVLKDNMCVNSNPKPLFPAYEASRARYITYLGLCLVTCIIFRHNIFIASAIGVAVAMYIMASERSLDTEHGRNLDTWLQRITW